MTGKETETGKEQFLPPFAYNNSLIVSMKDISYKTWTKYQY